MVKAINKRAILVFLAAVIVIAAGVFAFVYLQNSGKQGKELINAVKLIQTINTEGGIDSLTAEEKEAADINHDGVIDVEDVNLLLQSNVGLK